MEAADHLLPLEEPEAGDLLRSVLEAEGIQVRLGVGARRVDRDGDGITVAVGTEPVLRPSGSWWRPDAGPTRPPRVWPRSGCDPTARTAPVDERCRVADGVWAVGDVTGQGAFTHVAMYQAGIVVRDLLGEDVPGADYRALPRVTFTDPEVGSVGLSEKQARERFGLGRTSAARASRARPAGWIHKVGNEGLIKLVADADRGVLVGATSMGPTGGEVLGALTLAVHAQVPLDALRSMIYAYPTFHRGIEDALRDLS